MPLTYLDHNATTPVRPEVAEAIAAALALGGNPSSVHRAGRAARQALETARTQVAMLAGAAPADIVFVSGGSEANHLALLGGCFPDGERPARILVAATEHDSVLRACPSAEILPVTGDGILDLERLGEALAAGPGRVLVSVMVANNETGVIQPVPEIARIVHAAGGLFHCDAVQAAGKLPIGPVALGADLMSLSGHKIGGPPGIGALVLTGEVQLVPLQRGGGQERGRRAGTENLPGIVGFGAAAALAAGNLPDQTRIAELRDEAARRLLAIAPGARIYGGDVPRLANTLCIGMPGVTAETQIMALDLAGVMVSAGAACSSGKVRGSHVLGAMGVPAAEAASAIRISFGWTSRPADIDHLAEAWRQLFDRAGTGSDGPHRTARQVA